MEIVYHIHYTDYFGDNISYKKINESFKDESLAIDYLNKFDKRSGTYYFIIKCYR
jgi:hypothetical protein